MFFSKSVGPGAIVLLLLSAACAANKTASAKCAPISDEWARFGTVYAECAVDQKAMPPSLAPSLNYRPTSGCAHVEMELVLDTLGKPIPESAKPTHSTDPVFLEAVLRTLPNLRWKPAMKDGHAVQQLASYGRALQVEVVVSSAPTAVRPSPSRSAPSRSGPRC